MAKHKITFGKLEGNARKGEFPRLDIFLDGVIVGEIEARVYDAATTMGHAWRVGGYAIEVYEDDANGLPSARKSFSTVLAAREIRTTREALSLAKAWARAVLEGRLAEPKS